MHFTLSPTLFFFFHLKATSGFFFFSFHSPSPLGLSTHLVPIERDTYCVFLNLILFASVKEARPPRATQCNTTQEESVQISLNNILPICWPSWLLLYLYDTCLYATVFACPGWT